METNDPILIHDKETPIEKFEFYVQEYPEMVLILMYLYITDEVLAALNFKAPVYVLNDETVYRLINETDEPVSRQSLEAAMVYLTQSQMIYRFTAALKFNIEEKSVKQLRVNSWGRAYFKNELIKNHLKKYQQIKAHIKHQFDTNHQFYLDALACFKTIDSQNNSAEKLKGINHHLKIKVVC